MSPRAGYLDDGAPFPPDDGYEPLSLDERPKMNGRAHGHGPSPPPLAPADPDVVDLSRYELEEPTAPPFKIEDLLDRACEMLDMEKVGSGA